MKMVDNYQEETVPRVVFVNELRQLADKLIPKRELPKGVPVEEFKKLFDTVCNFMKEHDLTISEASYVLLFLNNTFEKIKYEQKFNW